MNAQNRVSVRVDGAQPHNQQPEAAPDNNPPRGNQFISTRTLLKCAVVAPYVLTIASIGLALYYDSSPSREIYVLGMAGLLYNYDRTIHQILNNH